MRIGISGPGGTGKTTLVDDLSRELGCSRIAEGIWEWLAQEDLAGPWSLTAAQQIRMQRYAIAHKIEREVGSAFVSDRTTVDAVSLMALRMQRLGLPVPARLRTRALQHARHAYDVAVLLGPNRASDAVDEVALLDETLRAREHALTQGLYQALGTPVIRVPGLPAKEIAPYVLTELRQRIGVRNGGSSWHTTGS